MKDGTIEGAIAKSQSVAGKRQCVYHTPQHWVKACWTLLGHPNKKIARKMAYASVKIIQIINKDNKIINKDNKIINKDKDNKIIKRKVGSVLTEKHTQDMMTLPNTHYGYDH